MSFRYSKLAFINALLSLIPIFPLWTLFFGVGSAVALTTFTDCENAYAIVEWSCFAAALFFTGFIILNSGKWERLLTEKQLKKRYRLFNLIIYTLLNNALLIHLVGPYKACYGQSDSVLLGIYTGPIISLILLVIGFVIDIKNSLVD